MECKKRYYEYGYKKTFVAEVLACVKQNEKYEVLLDETLFYPQGGGQPADRGTLSGLPVLDVQEKNGQPVHVLNERLTEGQEVLGCIDWDFRYDLMRQHTAEHILSGIVHEKWGYDNVGFHMGADVVTLDFNGKLSNDEICCLETLANEIAAENREVNVSYPDSDSLKKLPYRSKKELQGSVRIVTVPGADVCACCGLHVARTGEVGLIKIINVQSYKGGVRLSMVAGKRALTDYQEKWENIKQISTVLSVPPNECAKAVEGLKAQRDALQWKLTELGRELFQSKLNGLLEVRERGIFFEEAVDSKELRKYTNMAMEKFEDFVVIFSGNDNQGYSFMIGSKLKNAKQLAAKMQEVFDCKAGGTEELIQGKITAKAEELKAFFLGNIPQ